MVSKCQKSTEGKCTLPKIGFKPSIEMHPGTNGHLPRTGQQEKGKQGCIFEASLEEKGDKMVKTTTVAKVNASSERTKAPSKESSNGATVNVVNAGIKGVRVNVNAGIKGVRVYHETQIAGQCGRHTVDGVLQYGAVTHEAVSLCSRAFDC